MRSAISCTAINLCFLIAVFYWFLAPVTGGEVLNFLFLTIFMSSIFGCFYGAWYLYWRLVLRPKEKRFDNLVEMANRGDAGAQYNVGMCFEKGDGVSYGSEYDAAVWFRKAAALGHTEAQLRIAAFEAKGEFIGNGGTATKAFYWWSRAAEQGNSFAQLQVGLCYERGRGVSVNMKEAAKWFRKAAIQGNSEAQCKFGLCCAIGQGTKQNRVLAVKWYLMAAAQNHAEAQFYLGKCFEDGNGIAKSPLEAVRYYRNAAYLGEHFAQIKLANVYENGEYAEKDCIQAYAWYLIAKDRIRLGVLGRNMRFPVKILATMRASMLRKKILDVIKRQQITEQARPK